MSWRSFASFRTISFFCWMSIAKIDVNLQLSVSYHKLDYGLPTMD